jgi:hypothetical protein
VDVALKQAVARLLAPESVGALGPEARRQLRRSKIAKRRRERGRPLAPAVRALGPEAFDKLGTLDRDLVQRYYGIGEERRWTRRELAREYGLSTGRIEDFVNAAVGDLTGMDVAPRFERTCAVCGVLFTVRTRVSRRRRCDSACESELKRAAATRASARTQARGTDASAS